MAANPKDSAARKLVGKFARTLLATTCLTVGGAAAYASDITYTEGTLPAPADFSNTFGGADLLTAADTTIVRGGVSGSDPADFFEITGLGTGIVIFANTPPGETATLVVFNSANVNLNGPTVFDNQSIIFALPNPVDGNLIVEIERNNEAAVNYQVDVFTGIFFNLPEPSTMATLGLGLAGGAVALSRRRRKL